MVTGSSPMFLLLLLQYKCQIITTEYCGFSIQTLGNTLPPPTMENPGILGSSFWQEKHQAGPSSRPGTHAIFWPWDPQVPKVLFCIFAENTNFSPEC